MANMQKQLEAQIAKASKTLQSLPKDDPRYVEVLNIRAEATARLKADEARGVHADVPDAELEARLVELDDDAGELEIAKAEWQDAKRLYPDQVAMGGGRATAPDPRALKAQRKFEELRREHIAVQAELEARAAVQHRADYLDGRIAAELENVGLADDQRLQAAHDKAVSLDLYEEAADIKARMRVPYQSRPWGEKVAKRALDETNAQLAASPGIRTVGKLLGDNKATQEMWDKTKTVVEGR